MEAAGAAPPAGAAFPPGQEQPLPGFDGVLDTSQGTVLMIGSHCRCHRLMQGLLSRREGAGMGQIPFPEQ